MPDETPRHRLRRATLWAVGLTMLVALAIQFVPYGWHRTNPPVIDDAPWPNDESEQIARTSCYACHSNETEWPPYSYVAPMSWLVIRDVDEGRDELNFSDWDRDDGEADDSVEEILDGTMPPSNYTAIHRDARLSDDEIEVLTEALETMDRDD